jgi:ABC-2 type transport system ATP-binding protein
VTLHGEDITQMSPRELRRAKAGYGVTFQEGALYSSLTVRENIQLYGGIYDIPRDELRDRIRRLIDRLGLQKVEKDSVRSIPLGWKQKLALSIALLHEPKVVFLDEPTSGVDPITRRQFWEMIYEAAHGGTTVLVTTHYMDEAEYCDRISIMVAGRIEAIGTPSDLKRQAGVKSVDDLFVRLARSA